MKKPVKPEIKLNSEQVDKYLRKLGVKRNPPTFEFLRLLHKAHLLSIPFENLDFYFRQNLIFDVDHFFVKIIHSGRGGISIELNILFYHLLIVLGFDCWLVSARKKTGDEWNLEHEHPVIIIDLDANLWLADVGSIGLFLEPKKLQNETLQLDFNQFFRFVVNPDNDFILQQSKDSVNFRDIYLLKQQPMKVIQFLERFDYHQKSSDSYLKQNKVVSKTNENGFVKLTDTMLLEIAMGEKKETPILHEDDFAAKLQDYFNINYYDLFRQRFGE